MKVCAEPGCTELTRTPKCPTHTANRWTTSTRRQQLPPGWPRLRATILDRDRHTCTTPGCGAPATEVDHIDGHNNDPANLRSLCTPHHIEHTTTQATTARARLAALNRGESPC